MAPSNQIEDLTKIYSGATLVTTKGNIELLGITRSKFQSIPIPNADLQLNGESLVSTAREDKEKLLTQLKEFLDNLTNAKLVEQQATLAENLQKQLRFVPMPHAIVIG
jgi:hypothetical protein